MTPLDLDREIAQFDQSLSEGVTQLDLMRSDPGFDLSLAGAYQSSVLMGRLPLPSAQVQALCMQIGLCYYMRSLAERKAMDV